MIKRNGYVDPKKLSPKDAERRRALLEGKMALGDPMPATGTFVGAALLVRHDPDTDRWVISLESRTSREDVPVAWKQTEKDALDWALNYGVRK